jgi:hypothetical protein
LNIDLTKERAMSNFVNLKKTVNEVIIEKGLENVKAQVKLVLDASGSMNRLYRNGTVQRVVERVLAVGSKFDDDQKIEVYLFDNKAHDLGEVGEDDFFGFVDKKVLTRFNINGGTSFAPVMRKIVDSRIGDTEAEGFFKSLFNKKKKVDLDNTIPTYVLFITDGENDDRSATEKLIKEVSDKPIFWQFIGIGNERFSFLKELDNIDGRTVDNANFFQLDDIDSVDDKVLYDRMLNEFPSYLVEAKKSRVLK